MANEYIQLKNRIEQLNQENINLKDKFDDSLKEIERLNREIQRLQKEKQILAFQVESLSQTNSELNNIISTLKIDPNVLPIIPLKQIENFPQKDQKLNNFVVLQYSHRLQLLNEELVYFNQFMQSQIGKNYPYQISVEQGRTELNFPFQNGTHDGVFNYLTKNNSIHQLRNIVLVETSSDFDHFNRSKENVLLWKYAPWVSNIEYKPWISLTFLSSEFLIKGYRICADLPNQPISFQLEGKTKKGTWTPLDKRNGELTKVFFENSSLSETSFECQQKGIFDSFRLVNLEKATHGDDQLCIYSIELFGTLRHLFPRIVEKIDIKSQNENDQNGVLYYLKRKFSLPEFQSRINVTASSTGNPLFPPENILYFAGDNWFSSNSRNQFIIVKFISMELEIESYRFEVIYKWRPLGWQLEGRQSSSDQWKLLDHRGNEFFKQFAKDNDWVALTFNCRAQGKFQEFKFQMNSTQADGDPSLNLYSIEFFGILYEFIDLQ